MKRYIGLFKEAFAEFGDDKAQRLAAALAYYTIFSIAPLLLIAIAIAGLVFGREAAQHQIVGELRGLFGSAGATAVEDMLKSAAKPKSSTFAIVAGAVTLLFGAAGVFGQLKSAMNTIWDVEEKKGGGIGRLIKDRFLSFAMVMGVGFLLLVTLVVDAGLNAMGAYAEQHLPGGEAPWHLIQFFVSFGVITVLFTMIFRFLPDARPEFRDVWLGATFTAFLFTVGKVGLGLYLGRESVGSAYGAAGSLVVLLFVDLLVDEHPLLRRRVHAGLRADARQHARKWGPAALRDGSGPARQRPTEGRTRSDGRYRGRRHHQCHHGDVYLRQVREEALYVESYPLKKIIIAVAVVVLAIVAIRLLPVGDWLHQFQTYVRGLGALGYVVYAVVYAVCVVFLVPASLLTLGAGAIFGLVAGSIVVTIGATLGATAAFILAQTVLRKRVQTMTAGNPKLQAIDAAIGREGTKLMLLMRVSGFPPFTWTNYALGLTGVRLLPYVLTTLFGIIPGVIAFTYAGSAGAAVATGSGNRTTLIITAIGAILVAAYIARIAARALRPENQKAESRKQK